MIRKNKRAEICDLGFKTAQYNKKEEKKIN
jgi:hypothetical protein